MDVPALRSALLAWYDARRRDLPWRGRRDPYGILVSEVMLQQTRVATVVPRYQDWMRRFPTASRLAAASDDEVLAAWQGLGYYRRARALHAAARRLADSSPHGVAEWRKLPGVGPYTAAALASIVDGAPAAAVDGNVRRVVARLLDVREPVDRGAGARAVEAEAQHLLEPARPGDWNQAMMELGATVCLPRTPRCGSCPVATWCRAEDPASLPVRSTRAPVEVAKPRFAVVRRRGRILMVREEGGGLLDGLWRLPGGDGELVERVRRETGHAVELGPARTVEHRFTHRHWRMCIHDARLADPTGPARPAAAAELPSAWIAPGDRRFGISTAMRKAIGSVP